MILIHLINPLNFLNCFIKIPLKLIHNFIHLLSLLLLLILPNIRLTILKPILIPNRPIPLYKLNLINLLLYLNLNHFFLQQPNQILPNPLHPITIQTIKQNLIQIPFYHLKLIPSSISIIVLIHYTKIKIIKIYKAWVEDHSDVTDISKERLIQRADTTDLALTPNSDSSTEVPRRPTGVCSHTASIWSPMSKSKLPLRPSKLAELPSTSTSSLRCQKRSSTSE